MPGTSLRPSAPDWTYTLTFSSASTANSMAVWVNDRKENQFDLSIVTVDDQNGR